MKPLRITVRLAIWYSAVLTVTVALFGVVAFEALTRIMIAAVDEDLKAQLQGYQALLSREAGDAFAERFLEHTASGDLVQVADTSDHWLFRSRAIEPLALLMQPVGAGEVRCGTINVQGVPFRVLTAGLKIGSSRYRIQLASSLVRYQATVRQLAGFMFLSVPLLLIVSTAGGYWLGQGALTPVDRITEKARRISEQNLGDRLPVPAARDQLHRLASTLNAMLDRIEQAFQRNTRFTADASHELRTPLTFIRTTAEIYGRQSRDEAEYREGFARIVAETEKTAELLDNLLTLARSDAGFAGSKKEWVDLREILLASCERARPMAEAKGVTLSASIAAESLFVYADCNAIERLLMTLLENGIKYTKADGRVSVELGRTKTAAVISVTDNGIGISEADLPHIFERFYRADKARSRAEGGSGLGLAIARWIVDAHDGSIVCRSVLGSGSTFEVTLPVLVLDVQSPFRMPG